jgi:hypothetical protein
MAKTKSARERLVMARAEHTAIEHQIETVTAARRQALLADDDLAAGRADHRLIELRLMLQRAADQVKWLPELVAVEDRERDFPSSVSALKEAISTKSRRLRELEAIPRLSHSAASEAERDHLRQRVPALRQRLELFQRMEAPSA